MVSVDKPYVDIFTRVEGEPEEEKPKKGDTPYSKFKKPELERMLMDRDEEMAARFKQDPSAIDRVTDLVSATGISTPDGREGVNWHDDAAIYELLSDENIEMMTTLRKSQIRAFARAWWICTQYDYEYGKHFIRTMLKFAISGEGLGRSQFLKALMSGHPVEGLMGEEGEDKITRLGEILRSKF